jgi:hypothetical protein
MQRLAAEDDLRNIESLLHLLIPLINAGVEIEARRAFTLDGARGSPFRVEQL